VVKIELELTEEQAKTLDELAAAEGRTRSELLLSGVEALLQTRDADRRISQAKKQRALAAVGRFHAGVADLSIEHDRYLNNSFMKK